VAFSAKVGAFNTGTGAVASTVVVNDVGFQPVALIVWYSLSTSTGTDSTGAGNLNYGIGFATGASDRRTCSIQVENGSNSADTDRFTTDAALVQTITIGGATAGLLDVQSFDSGGFTLVVDDQFPSSIRVHYLALGGSDITNAATGSFTNVRHRRKTSHRSASSRMRYFSWGCQGQRHRQRTAQRPYSHLAHVPGRPRHPRRTRAPVWQTFTVRPIWTRTITR
jgi:hypothetical protein